ncbi:uncharacterized protein LOC111431826 [Cucurbita moschata]|uniref:Uncharacterized protein LOC111431826 n=1 Tax=Cucurbita moschata TaxID=3662 RepID=A0A6J1EEE5_CUCMO|nr:uncharacterized protein LOC111431826 [Cucurbita moschata]
MVSYICYHLGLNADEIRFTNSRIIPFYLCNCDVAISDSDSDFWRGFNFSELFSGSTAPPGEYYGFTVGGYEVLGRKREREMEGLVVRSPFVSTGKKLPFSPLLDSLPSCSASGTVIAITVLKSLKCRRVTRLNWTHG